MSIFSVVVVFATLSCTSPSRFMENSSTVVPTECIQRYGILGQGLYRTVQRIRNCLKETCYFNVSGQVCERVHTVEAECGRIQIGRMGAVTYPPNSTCEWIVKVNAGNTIKITVEYLDMELGSSKCPYDSLALFDGYDNKTLLGKYCGQIQLSFYLYTSTNTMTVQFKSDDIFNYHGFSLIFVSVPDKEKVHYFKQYQLVEAESGSFSSTEEVSISHVQRDIITHRWLIRSSFGSRFKFDWFVSNQDNSTSSTFQIYNGPTEFKQTELLRITINTSVSENGTVFSPTFQAFVVFRHKGNASLNMAFESIEVAACTLQRGGFQIPWWSIASRCPWKMYSYIQYYTQRYDWWFTLRERYILTYKDEAPKNIFEVIKFMEDSIYHVYYIPSRPGETFLVEMIDERKDNVMKGPYTDGCHYIGFLVQQGHPYRTVYGPMCSPVLQGRRYIFKRCFTNTPVRLIIYSFTGVISYLTIIIQFEIARGSGLCPNQVIHQSNNSKEDVESSDTLIDHFEHLAYYLDPTKRLFTMQLNITQLTTEYDITHFTNSIRTLYTENQKTDIKLRSEVYIYARLVAFVDRPSCLRHFFIVRDGKRESIPTLRMTNGFVFGLTLRFQTVEMSIDTKCENMFFESELYFSFDSDVRSVYKSYSEMYYRVELQSDLNLEMLGIDEVEYCYYVPGNAEAKYNRVYYKIIFGIRFYGTYLEVTYRNRYVKRCGTKKPMIPATIRISEFVLCASGSNQDEMKLCMVSNVHRTVNGTFEQWKTIGSDQVHIDLLPFDSSAIYKKHRPFHFNYRPVLYRIKDSSNPNCSTEFPAYLNNLCYGIFQEAYPISWKTANENCQSKGGHLLNIKTEVQMNFIKTMAATEWRKILFVEPGIVFIGLQIFEQVLVYNVLFVFYPSLSFFF